MTSDTAPRTELVTLEPVNRPQLDAERTALVAEVERALPAEIETPAQYLALAELDDRLTQWIKSTKPTFDELCDGAYQTWKRTTAIRSMFYDVPEALKARVRVLLGAYKQREERDRREAERKLAEEERQREIARQHAEAELLDAQGQPEIADAVRHRPVEAPAVVLPSAVPEVAGLSFREEWGWEPVGGDTPVNRKRALALLVRPEYLAFVQFDDGGLTSFAKRTRGTVKIPGIVFRSRQVPVRR